MSVSVVATKGHAVPTVGLALALWTGFLFAAVAPAAINGFPLVFDDTNVYISPLRDQWEGTPPFYSVFVFVVASAANLKAVPLVQAACALVTLDFALQNLVPRASASLRAAGSLAIVMLTQLPWLASWIMPDLFGGLGVVAVVALMMRRDPPPPFQGAALSMMALFSALSATANILFLIPTAALCLLVRYFWLRWKTAPGMVLTTVALTVAAVAMPVSWNAVRFDLPRLNVGSGALLFSKLVDSGIAQEYLADNCPRLQHPVCVHLERLHQAPLAQTFLWEGDPSLARQLNAWRDPDGSFGKLASDIMRTNLLEVMHLAMSDSLHLAARFTLGFEEGGNDELSPFPSKSPARVKVARFHASLLDEYDRALQQAGDLVDLYFKNFYAASGALSYTALLLVFFLSILWRRWELGALMFVFAAAIIAGIVVHGGLVGPYARYNVKLSWLASFALLVFALRWLSSRTRTELETPVIIDETGGNANRPCRNLDAKSDAKGIVIFQEVAFRGQV